MKKDKEWLKEQLSYLQDGVGESFNDYSKGLNAAYNTLELLINQLEEPQQEKVVVPQFVADYYETVKHLVLSAQFDKFKYAPDKKVWNWYRECEGKYPNPEANAQLVISMIKLGRYEVEKEKLYHVPLHDGTYLVSDDDKNLSKATTYFMHQEDSGFLNRVHIFTEQEIKSIDERYWAFAEEVTE